MFAGIFFGEHYVMYEKFTEINVLHFKLTIGVFRCGWFNKNIY